MLEQGIYFNFPIQLLENFIADSKSSLTRILYYSLYADSRKNYGEPTVADFEQSCEYFEVTIGNSDSAFKVGKQLFDKFSKGTPKVGIRCEKFWEFYSQEKEEFEKVVLLAFLALKSIVQQKPYIKINNNYWLSRMDGKAKAVKDKSELSTQILKYSNEYQLKKIKRALEDGWRLSYYGKHIRGFFISFKMPLVDLIVIVEKLRKGRKEKDRKTARDEAFRQALVRLNG